MSAIAAIKTSTLIDTNSIKTNDAAISVGKTWDPEGFNPQGIAQWVDRSGGIQVGFPRLSLSVRRPTTASRVSKVQLKLSLPTLEVTAPTTVTGIQPAPTKAYDCSANLEFLLPERATQEERRLLFQAVMSLFCSTISASDGAPTDSTGSPLIGAVVNLDQPY